MKQLLNRVRDWLIRKLGGVPRKKFEEKERLVIELQRALDACRSAPVLAKETREIVPVKMQATLYGIEEETYFPEQALQEIHNAKREHMARELGQAMLDKGLIKIRIRRDPYAQQVIMELRAEVVE